MGMRGVSECVIEGPIARETGRAQNAPAPSNPLSPIPHPATHHSSLITHHYSPATEPRIQRLLAEAERKWGRGALVRWGDAMEEEMETIPTGFPDLDEAIGIGGLPCGRISELFGADSSGKQALAAAMAVQCQNQQGVVAWIDPAGRLDPEQMRVQGVRPDALLVARPRNELEALEMAVRLARSGGVKLLVFDLMREEKRERGSEGEREGRACPGLDPW